MENGTILIVDDESDIRELLKDFLEGEGFVCQTAANAFEALNLFQQIGDVALLMSDIRMPGKSGLDLLAEIKALDEDVIVIMISAVKDIESAITAMSNGAYDYVSKPFKLNEVAMIAHKALEKRRLVLENKAYQKELEKKVAERTRELQVALKRLDNTYTFTLRALVTALDTRDEETQGHSMRVVHYTLKIARLMSISDQNFYKVLEYGALLHDIGKIGIPDAILRKPGKLTPEEWVVMRQHPEIGYGILHRIEFLEEASRIVLHHHENYNGTGYPQGLREEEIPIGSRIFAVADTLDAMTSDRPYRKALSLETVASELDKFSGQQFDPVVVKAFHQVSLDEWSQLRNKLDEQIRSADHLSREMLY
jgi:putative nucleotidyltransferase with HDIG domain